MWRCWQRYQFGVIVLLLQVLFLILFGLFSRYHQRATGGYEIPQHPTDIRLPSNNTAETDYVNTYYPLFQDVHVMIFIGFAYLMTFLRRYGFMSLSINLLLSCIVIQWAMIVNGFWSEHFAESGFFYVSVEELLSCDFAAATVLITMGALLGKVSPAQYVIIAMVETSVGLSIEHFVIEVLKVNDVGDSMVVHAFGAYFGLAVSFAIADKRQREHDNEGSNYNSDVFSMIGALFLWIFWPSFNGALGHPESARHRALINTYLSLVACTVFTFILSQLVDTEKKMRFNIVHIANSTLAGGVGVGTIANVILYPFHALLIGCGAAVISVFGFAYITPFLAKRLKIHDTCGVNNLHGMPGVYAGILSFILACSYDTKMYGKNLAAIYPSVESGERNEVQQGLYQLAGLATVLASSIISGFLTGLCLRLPLWNQVDDAEYYADAPYFEVPQGYELTKKYDKAEEQTHCQTQGSFLTSVQVNGNDKAERKNTSDSADIRKRGSDK
ncbi:hypothetical protein AB6A40_002899 [Gnathostoma spinigerum]|uniref:Ammonium transporter AmtB-like domain-containing protein n=1 Tax=Gnathostoma spinigerum TaxID=75299 RepID=A0ABD6E7X8_9BILA